LDRNLLRNLPESMGMQKDVKIGFLSLPNNPLLSQLPHGMRVIALDITGCFRLTNIPDDLFIKNYLSFGGSGVQSPPLAFVNIDFVWYGLVVSDTRIIFHPETITLQEILAQPNAEQKRVLVERMGYERLMREVPPQTLDSDQDTNGERHLLMADLKEEEPVVCLKAIDPYAERPYVLRVPPTMETCQQAAEWLAEIKNSAGYRPRVKL
jgi:hypothetical protein